MSTSAQLRASKKYDKEHTKSVLLKLNVNSDADILSKLGVVGNKQGYIKDLVRNDIRGGGDMLTLDAIKMLLLPAARKYDLSRVFLFGSYARGEAGPGSDVDILIEGGNLGTMKRLSDLSVALEESLGRPVDIITMNMLNRDQSRAGKRLRNHIEKDKVLVYEKDK